MSKKDYELIAAAIRVSRTAPMGDMNASYSRAWDDGIRGAAATLADALSRENPKFDRSRFLLACGVAP